jgi:hypothetical protein
VLRCTLLSPAARLAYALVLATRPGADGTRVVRDGQLLRWLDCSPGELRTVTAALVRVGLVQIARRGHHAGAWQVTTSLDPHKGRRARFGPA